MDDRWDAVILSFTGDRWKKVARIIAEVCKSAGDDSHMNAIEGRIRALVADGQLEAVGDISRWGYCEVRRPQSKNSP
jgi:hypothetical protein